MRHAKKEYDKQYRLKNKESLIKYRLKIKRLLMKEVKIIV